MILHPAPGTPVTFYCNEMEGRYVNVVIPGEKRFLTLCEVEITGEPVEKPRAAGNIKPIYYNTCSLKIHVYINLWST